MAERNTNKHVQEMLGKLLHDMEKPRANFKMFAELYDEISGDPEKVSFWINALEKSFERFDQQASSITETLRKMNADA